MRPRVLFVSKPIAPPFHDGTKCLVRDIACNLDQSQPIVMSVPDAAPMSTGVELAPVYRSSGAFSPSLGQNARAAAWLLLKSKASVWHFVFAPNTRTSAMGRWLSTIRRVPVVQTVASPPRSFDAAPSLLFGDVVVAQSHWTRDQLRRGLEPATRAVRIPHIEVIPPPVGRLEPRAPERLAQARHELGIAPDVPLYLYPGDLETSSGAESVAALAPVLTSTLPGAVTVFAYRNKSPAAPGVAQRLAARLDPAHTRFTDSPGDIISLISTATAVVFPVDDLWGKVDLPIVLLEAMSLGVPVVAIDHGPLSDLAGAELVPYRDTGALAAAAIAMARNEAARNAVVARQLEAVNSSFSAARVARRYEGLYLELCARGQPKFERDSM